MEELFLTCLNLSIRASYMILAVLFIRLLFSKAGRKYIVWLWIAVGIRLICPFSISSLPTLLPHTEVIPTDIAVSASPQIASGFQAVDQTVNHVLQENFTPAPADSVNPLQVINGIAAYIWIAGIVLMLAYMIISSVLLKIRIMRSCTPVDGIAESSQFEAPFVFGMFRPVICLPPRLEEKKKEMILLHERTHIERKDYILKPLGFIILSIYWFHPLVWLAYRLLCRDIEMACDEAVIQKMKRKQRSNYAETLLECASSGHVAVAPVAFGETDVKKRIKNILKYRKPSAMFAVGLLVCASVICAGCFADSKTEPQGSETPDTEPVKTVLTVEELLQDPAPYIDRQIYVQGTLPQSSAGTDEDGKPILYLSGAGDLNKHIRIVDYTPTDGSCPVEAYGTVVTLDSGDLALSMEGYTVLEQQKEPEEKTLTVEELIQNPEPYLNTEVHILGNLPQSAGGKDENGEWILWLCGVNDTNQHIRIVDYTPTDGSCLVEAWGKVITMKNGDLALSMEGYTVKQEQPVNGEQVPEPQPDGTVLTVEELIQNPSPYLNTYVHVQGNLPQSTGGKDENGDWILYLSGVNDLDQHIRIVNFTPSDGSCLVEAYGTVMKLANGDLAISMEGYTILQEQQPVGTVLKVEDVIENPTAYVNTYVYVQGTLPQGPAGKDENGDWILWLSGADDLSQHIRIVDYTPTDGSCPVEAYGTLVRLSSGDLALSMEGYIKLN